MLSDESVERFRVAYRESYGEEISVDEAREMAQRLLQLYERLYAPLPSELDELNERPAEEDFPSSPPDDGCSR